MSSDEDVSLVTEQQSSEDTLEGIMASIDEYKKKHAQLLEEQKELVICRDEQQDMREQFRQRSEKLMQSLKDDELAHKDQLNQKKTQLNLLQQEQSDLMKEIQKVEATLKEQEALNNHLKQQADVFSSVPEKKLVFTGLTGKADDTQTFEMESHIVYPMEGGTALITFEEEVVAKTILDMKEHRVRLGESDCIITVEPRPVHLMLPSLVEIDTDVCPQRILISNLPKMDTEMLLYKLEIHFSKTRNGGGEVDTCEMMPDSGTVVITFVENNIAKGLTETEYHDVKLQQEKHRVRVTPFLNGKISDLKTKMMACPRTVLLTGIPAIMERETLQDLLEIHFQKNSNGGGEIEAFLYNPLGQHTLALFGSVSNAEAAK